MFQRNRILEFAAIAEENFMKGEYLVARRYLLKFLEKSQFSRQSWEQSQIIDTQIKLAVCSMFLKEPTEAEKVLNTVNGESCSIAQRWQIQKILHEAAYPSDDG
jgi:hypothetical protein